MAGKGPDLLVLDGLPTDSYKEKGVLLDISPYLEELETKEPLLANIKESFMEDGKITMIPAAVTLPMYYTEQENMTGVSDLSALADLFEKLRGDHPGEELMELYSKDMLFDAVFPVSAPNWITDAGEPDLERISGDLEQMKRIYDACMEGLPDQVLMKYKSMENIGNSDKASAYNDLGGGAVDAFTSVSLMGINAASQKSDLAGDFMQMILSKEMQSMIYPIGFPINEEGLERYLEGREALENAVREVAEIYFDGLCSLEEAMDGIREKSKIIMAE